MTRLLLIRCRSGRTRNGLPRRSLGEGGRRGEIWPVAVDPDYAGKPRPAVIVQDDAFDATRSVTLCPLTGSDAEVSIRPLITPSAENGLRAPKRLMVDKITTVSRERVQRRIGRLSREEMSQVSRSILTFLGLAGSNT